MNAEQYQKQEATLVNYLTACALRCAQLSRKLILEHIQSVNKILILKGPRATQKELDAAFDPDRLAEELEALIREWRIKPAQRVRQIVEEYKKYIAEKVGVEYHPQSVVVQNAAPKKVVRRPAKLGTIVDPNTPVMGYRRREDGSIEWIQLTYTAAFRQRYDLSSSVWASVNNIERRVFSLIQQGLAEGRDVRDLAADLEIYARFSDGGQRVMGRWRAMTPVRMPDGSQIPADADLRAHPYYDMWHGGVLDRKLTPEEAAYRQRFGRAGLDYRISRIIRTETTNFLCDEQVAIAQDASFSTGKVKWILDRTEVNVCDHCLKMSRGGENGQGIYTLAELDEMDKRPALHPNCECTLRVITRRQAEIEEYFRQHFQPKRAA